LRYWLPAIIISLLLLCQAISAQHESGDVISRTSKFRYSAEQQIDGVGFFATYQKVNTVNATATYGHILGYGERSHGSGYYTRDSTFSAWSQTAATEQGQTIEASSNQHNITFGEKTDYLYHPVDFNFGRTFKSGSIASKGKEDTTVWKYDVPAYDSNVRMTSLFDSTTALSKEITGSLFFDDIYKDNVVEYLVKRPSSISLNINANATGHAVLGMLDARPGLYDRGITVNNELEQDYRGTFTIAQKLSHKIDYARRDVMNDWLPCCTGGYLNMAKYEQMGTRGFGSNVKSIFDCTCFEPPIPQLPSKPSL